MLSNFYSQFSVYWGKLPRSQKIVIAGGGLLGVLLISAFLVWASAPDYAVAFTGLSESDAGAIVERLQEDGVDYKIESGGGTILVPSKQVNDMRLSMANKGLLGGSTVGFELFNSTSLGLSDFNQRINYQRATEGELSRTIESLSPIEAARVHIVIPEQELFAEQQKPATAAITVQLSTGKQLTPSQVQSIMHLVAAGVEGLQPHDVVIVDTEGNMLSAGFASEDAGGALLSADQRGAQQAYEAQVEAKVQEMLEEALGPNRSIVRVNAEMNWDTVEIIQQTFDPASVARSVQTVTESYTGAADEAGGVPGVETNLPDDDGALTFQEDGAENSDIDYSRTETTTNYEIASLETRTLVAPGEIETLSVSVLLDDVTDAATVTALTSIAAMAAGIDEERGDAISVQSMAFDRTFAEEQVVVFEAETQTELYGTLAMWAVVLIAVIAVLLFSQRLIRNLRLTAEQDVWTTVMPPSEMLQKLSLAGATIATGTLTEGVAEKDEGSPSEAQLAAASEPVEDLPLPFEQPELSSEMGNMQRAVEQIAEQQPLTVAEIIRLWLIDEES